MKSKLDIMVKKGEIMVESVAMEVLRPFFLQVDPYPICE
jgi:hypothetical protein